MNRPLILLSTLGLIASFSPPCLGQGERQDITRGKNSTAFVEVDASDGKSFGSGFCVGEAGLFITNAHVAERLKAGGQIKLVLRTGEEDQRVLAARVYRSDPTLDLALLTTETRERLIPLPLGRDEDLFIAMPTASFGYPFGKELALRDGDFPSISVNLNRITSLRKEKGKVELVQIDGQLNPGNSGGPVLGENGNVIGVASATVVGGGLNFAIPVGKLTQFLANPGLEFKPPALTSENCSEPTTWTIRAVPSRPSGRLPAGLSVSVKVIVDDKSPRTVMATPDGPGNFRASIIPVPESMVSQAPEMNVGVIVELKQGSNLLATSLLMTKIVRPVNLVVLRNGRVVVSTISNSDKGVLTVDGKLEPEEIPRGAGRSIHPPQVAIAPVRLTPSPDPPAPISKRATEDLLFLGHTRDACTVDSSSDGRKLLSGSDDGTVRLWDVASGKMERLMNGHAGRVHQVIFSPDGTKALSGGVDRMPRLWDLATGQTLRVFRGHTDWVLALAFTPDGKKVLTAGGANSIWGNGQDFAVRVWDADTAKLLSTWRGHTAMVFALRVSPDGKSVLSGSCDGTVRLWELSTGDLIRQLPCQTTPALDAIFTPDGKNIVASGDGNVARIFDIKDGHEVAVLRGHTSHIGSLSISKDGSRLATGTWGDRTIRIWALPEVSELTQANLASCPAYAVLTPDGRRLIAGCQDGSLHRFPLPEPVSADAGVAGNTRTIPLSVPVPGTIADVAVGGGGRYLILSLKGPRALAVFDVNLAKVVKTIPVSADDFLVAAGAETLVVAYPGERALERWDLATLTRTGQRIPSPIKGNLENMVMGSDSVGPLLVAWNVGTANGLPAQARFSFLDPRSMKVLKVAARSPEPSQGNASLSPSGGSFTLSMFSPHDIHIRASSGGDLFTLWRTKVFPQGVQTLTIGGGTLRARYRHESSAPLAPGPDGRTIFSGNGLRLDPDGNPIDSSLNLGGPIPRVAVPSTDPAFFMVVAGLSPSQDPMGRPIRVSLHSSNDGSRLLTMSDLGEMERSKAPDSSNWSDLGVDKRFHHIPAADLLITIPWSNDRVVVRRLTIGKALDEMPAELLVITSPPTLFAVAGRPFRHQIETRFGKGELRFERSSGPDGLTVSPTGIMSWPDPGRPGPEPVIVEVKVSGPGGLERSYGVRIRVK